MQNKDAIIAELIKQVETLMKRIQQLEEEVARLKRDSNNSSKPPSSDIVKPKTNMQKRTTKKRKRGGQPGHRKHTRKPFATDEIDSVIEYELCSKDLDGLIPLDDWHVVQQVTLPEKLYVVTEHRARKYLESKTGKIIIASLPNEIQQGGLLGADITAMTAYMKERIVCHLKAPCPVFIPVIFVACFVNSKIRFIRQAFGELLISRLKRSRYFFESPC